MTKRADLVEARGALESHGLSSADLLVKGYVPSMLPSELSSEQMSEAVEMARLGAFEASIARVLGVSVNTFVNALRHGRIHENSMYKDWAKEFYEARKQHMKKNLRVMNEATEGGDWKPAAWQLERSFGFAKQETVEHEVGPQAMSLMSIAQIPLSEAQAALEVDAEEVVVDE